MHRDITLTHECVSCDSTADTNCDHIRVCISFRKAIVVASCLGRDVVLVGLLCDHLDNGSLTEISH